MNIAQFFEYGQKLNLLNSDNLLSFSHQPSNSVYWKTLVTGGETLNNNAKNTEDVTTAPDGSMSGDRFFNNKINSSAYCFFYEESINVISGQEYVFSIYAKKDTTDFIQLVGREGAFGTNTYANFNLLNGVVGSKGSNCTSSIVYLPNGWFRCIMKTTATNNFTGGFSVGAALSATSPRLELINLADFSVFIFGLKIQQGATITDYKNPKNGSYTGSSKRLAAFGFGTDLHNSDLDPYVNNYTRDGLLKLQTAVNFWNTKPLDFVVINGDYTDGGFSGTSKILTEQEQIDKIIEAENVFDSCSFPRKYSLGNHDMDSLDKALNIANIASLDSSYYFYDINGVRFIHLDANYMFDTDTSDYDRRNWRNNNPVTQYINPAQRTWLTNTLNATTNNVVIFCHHGLHSTNSLNVNNASVVRSILENNGNVVAVFTGHEHTNLLTTINGIPYYSMMAMTSGASPSNAYSFIKVYENSVVVDGFLNQDSYAEYMFTTPPVTEPSTYDTDAEAFLTAANITDPNQKVATNDLVLDLKSAAIWGKMKAIYPILGGSATAHKWNLKNPLDTDAAFRLQFSGTILHNSNGMLPNGSTGYAKTFLTPSLHLTDRNHSLGVYVRSIGKKDAGFNATMGSEVAGVASMYITAYYQGKAISRNLSGSNAFIPITNNNAVGLLISSNLSGTCRFTLNGVNAVNAAQDKGSSNNTQPLALGGYNRNGVYEAKCQDEIAFAFVADALTDTETTDLYNSIQAFQTALGRNV